MITKIEDLKDTEHNKRYGLEIVRKSLKSIRTQRELELNWIVANREWITFTASVTFKNLKAYEFTNGMIKATNYEYKKRVLNKVRRRLSRSCSNWENVLPIDHFYRYEKEQGSFFKPLPKSNSPHHVHAIFPVKKELASRIFDFNRKCLDSRLLKDLNSIETVSTFLIEPLRIEDANTWFRYMMKGKNDFEVV